MESNLLINHPASLDTVTPVKRRQWCMHLYICASARQSITLILYIPTYVYSVYYTRIQELCVYLYIRPTAYIIYILYILYLEPCVLLCAGSSLYLGCDGSREAIIFLPASVLSRFPQLSNHLCLTPSDFWLGMLIAFANMWLYSISTSAAIFPPESTKPAALMPDFWLWHHLFKDSHHSHRLAETGAILAKSLTSPKIASPFKLCYREIQIHTVLQQRHTRLLIFY